MASVLLRRAVRRARPVLVWSFIALAVLVVVAVFLLPARPVGGGLIGLGAAAVIFWMTGFLLSRCANADEPPIGWIAADYIVKVIAVLAAVLLVRFLFPEAGGLLGPVRLVAATVIAAVLVTLGVQLWALVPRKKGTRASD